MKIANRSDRNRQIRNPRVSVTFPSPHYEQLQRLAAEKRVSVAWVVREAVREYLASQTPLFRNQL